MLGVGIGFRVLCVVLVMGLAGLAVLPTGWPVYLMIEVVGQLVVAAVAIRYADVLRRGIGRQSRRRDVS
ncbi:hypothetical protein [Micromonospora sp. DT47]|uniref:hypothetical protein n=1 Tax=Micromonospora sp. DT47 TaxID=3393431 RepID=UPI003CF6AEAB